MSKAVLKPPSGGLDQVDNQQSSSNYIMLLLMTAIIALLLIIGYLISTPLSSIDKQSEYKAKEKNISAPLKTQDHDNNSIESVYMDWLLQKKEADQQRMSLWAKKEYENAIEQARNAEQHQQQKKYVQAKKAYRKAIKILVDIIEKKQLIKERFKNKAEKAFLKNKYSQAKEIYNLAAIIDEQDEGIINGLKKIDQRIELIKLFNRSVALRNDNKLDEALDALNKAVALEPDNKKILQEKVFVEEEKKQQDFKNIISEVVKNIKDRDYEKAKINLSKAGEIIPDDTVVNELSKKLNLNINAVKIKSYQKKGKQYEKQEEWQKALNLYEKINHIDPYTINGKTNEQRVRAYIVINEMLEKIVKNNHRLQDKKIIQKAKKTLVNIKKEIGKQNALLYDIDKTPELDKKIRQAERVIDLASINVPVTLISDNKTDIEIYKIAKYGKLKNKTISLTPGVYTIVGTRSGYRDQRKKIKISASEKKVIVTIQCRERI